MARPKKIAIWHIDLGLESEVLPESLPAWEANGWTRVDDGVDGEEHEQRADDVTDPDEPGDNKE